MWEKIKKVYEDLKVKVIEAVLWAERELRGKAGEEKKAAVVKRLDEIIRLPWYLEWADQLVVAWLVDLACEKLNWLTDWKFGHSDEPDLPTPRALAEKLAPLLDAPVTTLEAAGKKSASVSIDDRLAALCEQYGIEPDAPSEPVEAVPPAPVVKPAEEEKPVGPYPAPQDDLWERSVAFVLKWEGGKNYKTVGGKTVMLNPADLGGPTNMGVTRTAIKTAYVLGIVKHYDVDALTKNEAKAIYEINYWNKYGWGELPWPVCLVLLDLTVNHGPGGMAKIVQRALVSRGYSLKVDGKYGAKTKEALWKAAFGNTLPLAEALCEWRKDYYNRIVLNKPAQAANRKGWFNRLRDLARVAGVRSPV